MCQDRKNRCDILVAELLLQETDEYRTAVVCFINCIILGTEDWRVRQSIRHELIGMHIVDFYFLVNNP